MTELTITPKTADKTARFKGAIAAGEHVAVTIKGGAEWLGDDNGAHLSLRVLDLVTGRTLAIFPRPPETEEADSVSEPSASADLETDAEAETEPQTDAWSTTGDDNADLYCELNLNTTRMVNAARHMLQVPVLFVMGEKDDQSDAVTRTLYFRDRYEVGFWPERIGDDTPYDLDRWPKKIDEWTEQIEEFTAQLQEMSGSINTALEDVETAISETMPALVESAVADQLDGKADKVASATDGNFAALDANGNLKDSGNKAADFVGATEFTTHKNNNDIHFTAAERAKLSGVAAGAQVNVIETVQRNGVAVPVTDKAVNIFVPTKTSQLENDGGGTGTGFATVGALNAEVSRAETAEGALSSRVGAVEGKIPSEASSSNQLADKAHVAAAISAVKNSRFAVVETLPASGEENVIYLVPAEDGAGDDVFDEYIWLVGTGSVGAWEKIASTRIDLSGYATKVGVNVLLSGKVDKETGKGLSSNDYTTEDKAKVAAAATGADVTAAVAPCLTRAEAVDGFTKWEVEEIASGKSFVGCEWHEGTAPDRGWVVSLMDAGRSVSLLIPGEPDDTSLTNTVITLSRTRIHPAIDPSLSPTSENPVQNKAVKAAVDGKRGVLDLAVYEDGIAPWTMTFTGGVSRVYEWNQTDGAWECDENGTQLFFDSGTGWHLQYYDAEYDVWSDIVNPLAAAADALRLEFESGQVFTRPVVEGVYPTQDALARTSQIAGKESVSNKVTTISAQSTDAQYPSAKCVWDALAAKQAKYPFVAATVANGALTLQNAAIQTWTPSAGASVTVGAEAYVTGAPARDMVLVIDCSSLTEGDEPTVTWGTAFHPRTDVGTDFACAAGERNVYYISEYVQGEFAVGGWQETAGGNGT